MVFKNIFDIIFVIEIKTYLISTFVYSICSFQVYRMCTARGGGQAFLCPEGTRFNQRTLVCDHQFRVSCAESSNFFHRNLIMHEESMAATKKAKTQNKGEICAVKCLLIHNFLISRI